MDRSALSRDRGHAPLVQQVVAGLDSGQIRARERPMVSLVETHLEAEVEVLREPSPYQIHAERTVAADTGQWSPVNAVELWHFGRVQQGSEAWGFR